MVGGACTVAGQGRGIILLKVRPGLCTSLSLLACPARMPTANVLLAAHLPPLASSPPSLTELRCGGGAAHAPRALQERLAVSQVEPGQRQLGYVVVTRPVRQGRLRLALEEVLSMQLDPPPQLPAAALPPGGTASPPADGAAGAAGAAAPASPGEGGSTAAASASALLGLGLGLNSEGSECASSLGSRASSCSNLRCAGATVVRSTQSSSCMADAAAAAPLRLLLVEDNAINMKVSVLFPVFFSSARGLCERVSRCLLREGELALACSTIQLGRLLVPLRILPSRPSVEVASSHFLPRFATGCARHPAPHGLLQHRYRRGWRGSSGGLACAHFNPACGRAPHGAVLWLARCSSHVMPYICPAAKHGMPRTRTEISISAADASPHLRLLDTAAGGGRAGCI